MMNISLLYEKKTRQKFESVSDVSVVLPQESKSSKHKMLNIFVLVYV